MKSFKIFLVIMLVATLSFGSAFAGAGNGKGFAYGNLTAKSKDAKDTIALKFLEKQNGKQFKVRSSEKDVLGITTLRIDQYYNDIPVYGFDQVVNVSEDGVVKSHVGFTAKGFEAKLTTKSKKINDKKAIQIAQADLGFTPEYDVDPTAKEYIYMLDDEAYYVYLVDMTFLSPEPGDWKYFVDMTTGKIIDKFNRLSRRGKPSRGATYDVANTVDVTGTSGLGLSRTTKGNNHTDGMYYLVDMTRGSGIITYDGGGRKRSGVTVDSSSTSVFNDAAAIDCQYNLSKVYDFYKEVLGRNSLDGNGMAVKATVHYGSNYDNAYWYNGEMVFGDGDGVNTRSYASGLDVVGHEYTHGVDEYTCALEYKNESGALSEALAEIMGTVIEQYAETNPDWVGGEDVNINGKGMNSLADPTIFGHPDHVSKRVTGTADNGGVHDNSHIINKAAYLISQGGTHYGITVQGHGYQTMAKVFYRAMTTYFTKTASWAQTKQACISAANDLYGVGSAQSISVEKAFTSVGIN